MQHLAHYTTASESHPFVHLCFALAFGLSAYNFFRAVTLDAGTCPKPSSDDELKTVSKGVSFDSTSNHHDISRLSRT
jgi:hypothetical protein